MNVSEQLQLIKQPIVEQCYTGEKKCSKIVVENNISYCKSYAFPTAKWRNGLCNMADHLEIEVKKDSKKVNPLKASKRAGKK